MRKPFYLLLMLMLVSWSMACAMAQNKTVEKQQNTTSPSALEYFKEGSAYYLKGDYQKAIEPYQRAFDLEKKEPTLEKKWWRVLVDNLGMSYGMTGDLKKAKDVFEYGITKDPSYPLFHYNMACAYAESGDEEKAIAYLRSAFENKKNIISGEQIPDPATDDSFQRYMKDEKFLKALKGIKQQ